MKGRSLTGRLIATVLCIEIILVLFVTLAAMYYQRRVSLRAFDVMLQGRADSIVGAVQDAEDAADNVLLDKSSLAMPPRDIYEVREENGRFLGSSAGGSDVLSGFLRDARHPKAPLKDDGEAHRLRLGNESYRVLILHGLRLIDPDEPGSAQGGKGTLHHIVVYYAAPTQPVRDAIWRAARFFLLADAIALLLSIAAVSTLIRRSLRPLEALATQASLLSPNAWGFKAPKSAYELYELAPLATALDTALQGLEKAFHQQRTFVNDAAHELKTSVTVLKSSLQLLLFRDRSREQYQAGIEACLADCGRMEELVQRMLLLARIEQATPPKRATISSVPLAEVVRQVLTQLESAAALRRIALMAEIEDHRMSSLDEEDCATLLSNLVMNAIQHSRAGTSILIRLARHSDAQMRLTVVDQGEGIAAEHLPLIFERFYRTDASRSRDTGGTGLGLAICKAIVESNGGSIHIQSEPGLGTTVTVMLPAPTTAAVAPHEALPLTT